MASKGRGYTKRDLDQWFELFREESFGFSISHFIRLLSIPKGLERDRLPHEDLTSKWSSHRLQAEILALQGCRREGGRKPKVIGGEHLRVS